jgi:hypothetical protein
MQLSGCAVSCCAHLCTLHWHWHCNCMTLALSTDEHTSALQVATNMAGRGTDIVLGGSAEALTKVAMLRLVYRRGMRGGPPAAMPACPAVAGAAELRRLLC